jgi:acyl dehydratase
MEGVLAADGSDESDWQARLQACVGAASRGQMVAPHAVNEAMIAMWADALLDDNPVYVDEAAARATGRPGIVAPPTMVQAWVMPKLSVLAQGAREVPGYEPWLRGRPRTGGPDSENALEVYRILAERGYENSAATNCRQVYHAELRPGDRVRAVTMVEKVSELKRTAMGPGHFLTTRWEFFDQDDRNVATQLWTVLRFRAPETLTQKSSSFPRRRESITSEPRDNQASENMDPRLRGDDEARFSTFRSASEEAPAVPSPAPVEPIRAGGPLVGRPRVGQRTEATVIPITPSFVVATALATHDFYAIHHDVDWARSVGRPNIFQNILTTTGLVGGVATRWGGPAVRLRSVDLRLLAPNYPGDECSFVGEVMAVEGEEVTMAVKGTNGIGTHVEATVVATVPTGGAG